MLKGLLVQKTQKQKLNFRGSVLVVPGTLPKKKTGGWGRTYVQIFQYSKNEKLRVCFVSTGNDEIAHICENS